MKYMDSTIRMYCDSCVKSMPWPGTKSTFDNMSACVPWPESRSCWMITSVGVPAGMFLPIMPAKITSMALPRILGAITDSTTYTVISANTITMPSLYGDISPIRRLAEGQKCCALRTGAPPLQSSAPAAASNSSTAASSASSSASTPVFGDGALFFECFFAI